MTVALGSNAVLKFCQEQVWGTTPGSPAKVYGVNIKSESVGSTKNLFQSDTINQYRSVVGLGDGNLAVAGNIVTDLFPEGLEILLRHLLGKPTVTTTGSGPYTHVMKGDGGYLEGLSLEKGFVNISQYFKYTGCRVNSMNINLVQEGFHEVTFDFVGKEEVVDTATQITGSAVYGNKNGYTGYQCVVSTDHATPGVYVDLGNVVSGSISINNNFETDKYVLGSAFRASALPGKRECKGDFTVFFEDTALYNVYKTGAECGMKFTFTNLTGQQLIIHFPIVKVGGEAPKIASAGGVNLPLNFQARRDGDTEMTDVIITLVNTVATIETAPGE
jgi:hypothetical protein